MSYALPDEPQGAVRPDLAVSTLWPLLTVMLVGPLAGFAWLAFNSWALGYRNAMRHTVIAAITVPATGVLTILIVLVSASGLMPGHESLGAKLGMIALQGGALVLAFWIMWEQDDAEQWRKTFGAPLRNGMPLFFVLFGARLFFGSQLPFLVQCFVIWVQFR